MHRNQFAIALLALAALTAGCRRETGDEAAVTTTPPPAAEVAPAAEPAPPPTDATTVVENTAADSITAMSKDFDARAFAGTFSGTGAEGTKASLTLKTDGHFELSEGPQQAGADNTIDGTWTAEQDGKRIRLDPNSKSEPDRVYAIASNDLLTPLGSDGRPAADGTEYRLRRSR